MASQIRTRREGAVEVIEFNNPPFNFISHQMLEEFYQELVRARNDREVRVLVLTGGMPDSFITHYDVSELLAYSELGDMTRGSRLATGLVYRVLRRSNRLGPLSRFLVRSYRRRPVVERGILFWALCLGLLDAFPKPVIAAISGMCLGGGCEISLCCDFRYMAIGRYYRIGLPEVLVGIIPGGTGTPQRLPRVVGEGTALEMLLTGGLYTPEEAEAMGLIHKAMPPEELMPFVMELAQRLERGAPIAQAAIKRSVREGSRMEYHAGRVIELFATNRSIFSEDAKRGMARYLERIKDYELLDLEGVLEATRDLRAGREVEFKGD